MTTGPGRKKYVEKSDNRREESYLCRSAANSRDGRRETAFADFFWPRRARRSGMEIHMTQYLIILLTGLIFSACGFYMYPESVKLIFSKARKTHSYCVYRMFLSKIAIHLSGECIAW